MNKSEVYSWRVHPELKARLEDRARSEGTNLARLLERITREWLASAPDDLDDEEEQRQIHRAAAKCIGKLHGGDPLRAQEAGKRVREKLRQRYGA